MKTVSIPERIAGGVDQRWRAETNAASEIVNLRIDDQGLGWVNDRGWEPVAPPAVFDRYTGSDIQAIYSAFVWTLNQGAEVYYLQENGGALSWVHPNANTVLGAGTRSPLYNELDSGRAIPKSDDPGTQYIPHGRMLVILNGIDAPMKFYGGRRVELFGWHSVPNAPYIYPPDPEYFEATGGSSKRNAQGTVAVRHTKPRGLGKQDATVDTQTNHYKYKVSWISSTGSESPLSDATPALWTFTDAAEQGRYGVQVRDIPIGPAGTVARRLYRTKNLIDLDNVDQSAYYYLAQIGDNSSTDYWDLIPDSLLGTPAPALTDSVTISPSLKFGASWNGRLWLGGGNAQSTRLIYSVAGAPEQFTAFNFFDVGVRQGGAITGLFAYFDTLLVFRERAIDIVLSNDEGTGFTMTTLDPEVGTTAINTVALVPGLGVVFLSYDGVYLISGATGGVVGSLTTKKISQPVQRELNRISVSSLARASAAYSHKEQEWWCHYPVDGNSKNSRGVVFHVIQGVWSMRHATSTSGIGAHEWNAITTNPAGWFILAPETKIVGSLAIGQTFVGYNLGLQVWSAHSNEGKKINCTVADNGIYTKTSVAAGASLEGIWASTWDDFGDDSTHKRVLSVYVDVVTFGHNAITLDYATDYGTAYTTAGTVAPAVVDVYGGSSEDVVYGASTNANDSLAVIAAGAWTHGRVTRLRWDVRTGLICWFRWRLRSTDRFHVLMYRTEYVPGDRRVLNVRAV
jgi:hypothetical protein